MDVSGYLVNARIVLGAADTIVGLGHLACTVRTYSAVAQPAQATVEVRVPWSGGGYW